MVANSSIAKGRFRKICDELAAWGGYVFIFISAFGEEMKQENRVDNEGYTKQVLSMRFAFGQVLRPCLMAEIFGYSRRV